MADALVVPSCIMLRVIITDENIRKLILPSPLESVHDLKNQVKEQFELKGEFCLQFIDPDFDDFMTLSSPKDITDRGTIKVVPLSIPDSDSDIDSVFDLLSNSSLLSSSPSMSEASSVSTSASATCSTDRALQWPTVFPIPSFSFDTEMKLSNGKKQFEKDGTLTNPTGMKSDILEKLAESIFSYKAYPSDDQFCSVAQALVKKHPYLKEPGSATGYLGWKMSLKFKMGNYRSKLRNHGCTELSVNSLKRKGDTKSAKNIKKPRKAEVNYLPEYPDDETAASSEKERIALLDELKKTHNGKVIMEKMAKTFSHRRQEVVLQKPLVADFRARWPALFSETEIEAEFMRITTVRLQSQFMAQLDKNAPKLIQLMKSRGGAAGIKIQEILAGIEENVLSKRAGVLKALCSYLGEDSDALFQHFLSTQEEEMKSKEETCTMGIFSIGCGTEDVEQQKTVAIVLEGDEVLKEVKDLSKACCLLFGLIYSLNLHYPKKYRYLFEVIQKIFMKLDGDRLSPKIQTLKNKLCF
ncbi:uncharacterized protein [Asterias amurensis]|uniref:uncharacterized protein n=1 Tax=Asterias amurensis TaxID=7602 RepID=UPI003AB36B7F